VDWRRSFCDVNEANRRCRHAAAALKRTPTCRAAVGGNVGSISGASSWTRSATPGEYSTKRQPSSKEPEPSGNWAWKRAADRAGLGGGRGRPYQIRRGILGRRYLPFGRAALRHAAALGNRQACSAGQRPGETIGEGVLPERVPTSRVSDLVFRAAPSPEEDEAPGAEGGAVSGCRGAKHGRGSLSGKRRARTRP